MFRYLSIQIWIKKFEGCLRLGLFSTELRPRQSSIQVLVIGLEQGLNILPRDIIVNIRSIITNALLTY